MQALHVDYPMAETGQVLQDAHAATPCHAMPRHAGTQGAPYAACHVAGLLHCVEQAAQHTHRARVHSCAQAAVRGKRDDCMQLLSFPAGVIGSPGECTGRVGGRSARMTCPQSSEESTR
jgi:hypothetical protein